MTEEEGSRFLLQEGKGSGLQALKLSRDAICKENFMLDSNICIKVIHGGQVPLVLNTNVIVFGRKDSHLIFLIIISQSATCGYLLNTSKRV